ncbi:MAG TPA: NTP transferase domain-containing protein [Gammaproteobacteria bacterium]
MSSTGTSRFHALVLAGERHAADPVAAAGGVSAKAFTPVAGRAMVLRVMDALQKSGLVSAMTLCGPRRELLPDCPELLRRIESGEAAWIDSGSSPSRSAMAGLDSIPAAMPVLITTADHPLLRSDMVTHFCRGAMDSGADAAAALAEFTRVSAAMPGTRRTVLRFRDAGYCGCNLYALMSPAGRGVVSHWRRGEESRKKPWRMIAELIGPAAALSYATGRLSLDDALDRLGRRLNLRVRAVVLPYPEAAVDVDTPADLELAERLLRTTGQGTRPG